MGCRFRLGIRFNVTERTMFDWHGCSIIGLTFWGDNCGEEYDCRIGLNGRFFVFFLHEMFDCVARLPALPFFDFVPLIRFSSWPHCGHWIRPFGNLRITSLLLKGYPKSIYKEKIVNPSHAQNHSKFSDLPIHGQPRSQVWTFVFPNFHRQRIHNLGKK